jgi:hypothetical protein
MSRAGFEPAIPEKKQSRPTPETARPPEPASDIAYSTHNTSPKNTTMDKQLNTRV